MPDHLKLFERLMYGSVALELVSTMFERPPVSDIIIVLIVVAIQVALIWAAARKGQVWAGWILLVLVALGSIIMVANLMGGSPAWLPAVLRPDTPPTVLTNIIDVIGFIMAVVALYFYFLGGRRSAPQS